MRLIDADNIKIPGDANYKASVKRVIESQPTAYDVDKVIKQLESQIELKVTQYPIHGRYIKKNMAIEIVKAGGVDE